MRYGVSKKRFYLTPRRSTARVAFVLNKARLLISMLTLNDGVSPPFRESHTFSAIRSIPPGSDSWRVPTPTLHGGAQDGQALLTREQLEPCAQMLLGVFSAQGMPALEFTLVHSASDLLTQQMGELEVAAER
jgi:hypothetical protein